MAVAFYTIYILLCIFKAIIFYPCLANFYPVQNYIVVIIIMQLILYLDVSRLIDNSESIP